MLIGGDWEWDVGDFTTGISRNAKPGDRRLAAVQVRDAKLVVTRRKWKPPIPWVSRMDPDAERLGQPHPGLVVAKLVAQQHAPLLRRLEDKADWAPRVEQGIDPRRLTRFDLEGSVDQAAEVLGDEFVTTRLQRLAEDAPAGDSDSSMGNAAIRLEDPRAALHFLKGPRHAHRALRVPGN